MRQGVGLSVGQQEPRAVTLPCFDLGCASVSPSYTTGRCQILPSSVSGCSQLLLLQQGRTQTPSLGRGLSHFLSPPTTSYPFVPCLETVLTSWDPQSLTPSLSPLHPLSHFQNPPPVTLLDPLNHLSIHGDPQWRQTPPRSLQSPLFSPALHTPWELPAMGQSWSNKHLRGPPPPKNRPYWGPSWVP